MDQHLVEGRHRPGGAVAPAPRRAGAAELRVVLVGALDVAPAVRPGLVHVDGAHVLAVGQPHVEVASEAERLDHVVADEDAVVGLRQRLDEGGRGPVGRAAVVVDARARRPLEREAAHGPAQQLVVLPGRLRHVGVREARLVREELDQRDLALAVGLEARQVLGDPVGERQRAALDQEPDGARGEDLGVRVEEPKRVVARGGAGGLEPRVAERPHAGELAVPGDGELGRRVAPFGDVARDELAQAIERLSVEAEGHGRGGVERESHVRAPAPGSGRSPRAPAGPSGRARPRRGSRAAPRRTAPGCSRGRGSTRRSSPTGRARSRRSSSR